MSHSQFHCTGRAYLDMHGLIFETSICYWQDQPGRSAVSQREEGGRGREREGREREAPHGPFLLLMLAFPQERPFPASDLLLPRKYGAPCESKAASLYLRSRVSPGQGSRVRRTTGGAGAPSV